MVAYIDADFNNFIFQQEGRLFQSWHPETFTRISGGNNMSMLHGFMHKYLKSFVLSLFGMIFDLTAKRLIGYDSCKSLDNLIENFLLQMHAGDLRGRKNMISMMKRLPNERLRCAKEGFDEDYFD
ncbi:hypothetical protein DsansV1_C29g0208211 [Dioscorea sansibarensis]